MLREYRRKKIFLSVLLRFTFVILLFSLIGYLLSFKVTVEQPTTTTKNHTNNRRDIQKLASIVENYVICKGVKLNTTEEKIDIYGIIAHDFLNDQKRSFGGSNFSTPEHVLHHFYHQELPHYNFEAELQLQSKSFAHDPLYSALFNDPIHAIRRGYGLEGSVFVGILPSFHSDCSTSVENIFRNAMIPSNIFVGVLDAAANESQRCIPDLFKESPLQEIMGFSFSDNVRIRRIHNFELLTDDAGENIKKEKEDNYLSPEDPMRFALLQLYRGESFVLLIRAGTILSYGWDWIIRLMYLYEGGDEDNIILTSSTPRLIDVVTDSLSAFNLNMTSTQVRNSSDVFYPDVQHTWTVDHLEKIMHACSVCAFLLVTPQECLTAQIQDKLTQFLDHLPEGLSKLAFALLDGQSSLDGLAIDFSSAVLDEYTDSVGKFVLNRNSHEEQDKSREVVNNADNYSLILSPCNDLFGDENKILYKERLERCWITYFNNSLLSAVVRTLSNNVFAPSVNHNSSDLLEVTSFPRSSDALKDISYISSRRRDSRGNQQSVVSLDFLFSKAEAFWDIPEDLELSFPSSNKSAKRAAPIQFDPFLPVLSNSEADLLASAKLYTSGWSFKAVTEPLTVSLRKTSTNIFSRLSNKKKNDVVSMRKETTKRLSKILSTHLNLTNLGISSNFLMGKHRLLKDFYALTNIKEDELVVKLLKDVQDNSTE